MDKLSIYDAKARFSELLERVQSGHSTTITKRGRVPAIFAAEVTNVLVVLERRVF
jgi:antitoxin (DNA-binding transcriptional repressor) of toxin-antitoxin stability system